MCAMLNNVRHNICDAHIFLFPIHFFQTLTQFKGEKEKAKNVFDVTGKRSNNTVVASFLYLTPFEKSQRIQIFQRNAFVFTTD